MPDAGVFTVDRYLDVREEFRCVLDFIDHYGRLMYLKKHCRILPGERTFFEVVECDDLAFRMDLFHNSFKQGAFSCLSCAGYQDGGVLFMTALILKAPQ